MSKWKKRGKRILIFLLIVGFIGGMMDHSQITAAASDAGKKTEVTGAAEDVDVREEESAESECVCTIPCEGETDCPLCMEDSSACGGKAPAEESDENEDITAEESAKPEETGDPADAEDLLSDGDEVLTNEDAASDEAPVEETPAGAEDPVEPEETVAPAKPEELETSAEPEETETTAPTFTQSVPADSEDTVTEQPADDGDADTQTPVESEADEKVTAAEALIKGLASLEELETFDQEQKAAVLEQLRRALDAYEDLDEAQRAQIPGADARLKELTDYFAEPSAPAAATEEQIKGAWDAMTAAMENWDAEVDISAYNITEGDLGRIWPAVAEDNPDLFYVLGYKYYTANNIVTKCEFTYNTQYNQNSVKEYRAAIDNVFAQVIESTMTDEQKVTALHDYLVQHMVYDQNANNNLGIEKRNAYEALVNGIGVCQGYTLAYAALLEKADIEVEYCRSQSMNHIWNYVKLNGNWYHADLTFDDATASSQVGETGYVKHTYFLLSDAAMQKASHDWDPSGITCNDTRYDNSWHKTAPISESAIYTAGGNTYYLKGEIVDGAPNVIYRGATLMKRDGNGNETRVASFDIEDLGSVWPMWPMFSMSFSRLSCSRGILYFNVGNSIYAFNPAADTAPTEIYRYEDTNKRIVTGLLSDGNEMTLEIYNSQTHKMEEKIKVPVFSLVASEYKVQVGYTTAPVLTVNPRATGFTWSKQKPDGSWEIISGENGSSYTMETGLPRGSYRYRVEATLDGKAVSSETVVIVTVQEEQKNFAFSESAKTVTYGDAAFTVTAAGAEAGSSVSYSSSDPSVASVDPKTGQVTIQKAGSAVITATASETMDYLEAESSYRLTVSPRALTWDVSALKAEDRLDLITDKAATLSGELKLAGILEKDAQAVRFQCSADRLTGVYETVAEGSQKVTLSWKSAQDQAVIQGDGKDNYIMPAALPEIRGTIRVTDDTAFKTDVKTGISVVPDSFKDKEHLNTPAKIEKAMKVKLQEKASGIAETNMVVYDVELLINVNGSGWQKATKDNFPSEGLTITLPYPSGTGKNTHDFVVAHMFTEDMNGFSAGDVEYPAVTKTDTGITFKVYGLSPIAVGWKTVSSGSTGGGNNNAPATPAAPADSANQTNTPHTGDTTPVMPYVLLASAASCVIIGLCFKRKRSR